MTVWVLMIWLTYSHGQTPCVSEATCAGTHSTSFPAEAYMSEAACAAAGKQALAAHPSTGDFFQCQPVELHSRSSRP